MILYPNKLLFSLPSSFLRKVKLIKLEIVDFDLLFTLIKLSLLKLPHIFWSKCKDLDNWLLKHFKLITEASR